MKDAAGIKAAIRQRGNMTSREQRRSGDWYSGRSVLCEGEVVVGLGWCRRCRLGAFQLVACRSIRDRTTTPTAKLILDHGTRLLIGLQPILPDVEVRVQSSKVWWSHNDLEIPIGGPIWQRQAKQHPVGRYKATKPAERDRVTASLVMCVRVFCHYVHLRPYSVTARRSETLANLCRRE